MEKLSHLDAQGKARMVDISAKDVTQREAMAKGSIVMQPATFALLKQGKVEKGDVLAVAQVAGIMAAKQTPHLIPMCHPVLLTDVRLDFELDEMASAVHIPATVKTRGQTGVEMEALTAVAVGALTIYDMCKAADASMHIEGIRLVKKSGGKSGTIILE